MTLPLKPARGGFLRPFGCGWFIREFLMGNGPNGSPQINPDVGAPQADIFYHYKTALLKAIALDRATRAEERQARREKRAISPEEIERLAERYLARTPHKTTSCRYHSFVVYFANLRDWVGWKLQAEKSLRPSKTTTRQGLPGDTTASPRLGGLPPNLPGQIPSLLSTWREQADLADPSVRPPIRPC